MYDILKSSILLKKKTPRRWSYSLSKDGNLRRTGLTDTLSEKFRGVDTFHNKSGGKLSPWQNKVWVETVCCSVLLDDGCSTFGREMRVENGQVHKVWVKVLTVTVWHSTEDLEVRVRSVIPLSFCLTETGETSLIQDGIVCEIVVQDGLVDLDTVILSPTSTQTTRFESLFCPDVVVKTSTTEYRHNLHSPPHSVYREHRFMNPLIILHVPLYFYHLSWSQKVTFRNQRLKLLRGMGYVNIHNVLIKEMWFPCCWGFLLINQLLIRPSWYQPTVDRGGSIDDSW